MRTINLEQDSDTVNNQLAAVVAERISNGENPQTVIKRLLDSITGNEWVDAELEKNIQECAALDFGCIVEGGPNDDFNDDDDDDWLDDDDEDEDDDDL